mgnify:CR=1 FL=1
MKAKKPYWDITHVQRLASAGQILLTETKAKASSRLSRRPRPPHLK